MTSGRFAIAFPLGVTIGKWTAEFSGRHPDVEVTVVRASGADQLDGIVDGVWDMAFVRLPLDRAGLHVVPLYEENVVVVLPEEHLLTLGKSTTSDEIATENRLTGEPDEQMIRSVADGSGVAVVPASVAKALRRRDVVALPLTDVEPSGVALAWAKNATNPLIDEFLGVVRGRSAHSSRSPEVKEAEERAATEARAARNAAASLAAKEAKAARGTKSTGRPLSKAAAQAKARARSAERSRKGRRR